MNKIFNKKKNKPYWKNRVTGEKTWHRPPSPPRRPEGARNPPLASLTLVPYQLHSLLCYFGSLCAHFTSVVVRKSEEEEKEEEEEEEWEEIFNKKKNKLFWKHRVTGEKTWRPPSPPRRHEGPKDPPLASLTPCPLSTSLVALLLWVTVCTLHFRSGPQERRRKRRRAG